MKDCFSCRKIPVLFVLALFLFLVRPDVLSARESHSLDPAIQPKFNPYSWPDTVPQDAPYPESREVTGITFTGRYANYTGADTFYPTWAPDGNLYSIWTDGYIYARRKVKRYECEFCDDAWSYLDTDKLQPYTSLSGRHPTTTGQSKIVGNSPLNLDVIPLGKMHSGKAVYPSVSVIADGIFYIGEYQAFDVNAPMRGFRYSKSYDRWAETTDPDWRHHDGWHRGYEGGRGKHFFPGDHNPRRFRVMHSVVLGQNNNLSPDGKIYMTAHGSLPGGGSDWNKGDAVYLCRVEPQPKAVNDPGAYEFFAGREHGNATWSDDVTESEPLVAWRGELGSESITYVPGLDKYILMTARLNFGSDKPNTLIFWESDQMTGPYKIVHRMENLGPATYFPNIPAKFISSDGRRAWLVVTANHNYQKPDPRQFRYALSMHEIVFNVKDGPQPEMNYDGENIAPEAEVEVSSVHPEDRYRAGNVNDGKVGGYPDQPDQEWASDGELNGAWVKLSWNEPRRIDRVWLYDRPMTGERIFSGTLSFSDGSKEPVHAWMSDRARAPTSVTFEPKTVRWVRFRVDEAIGRNVGLSEIEVYTSE